jgi:hypothetical protein
MVYDDERQTETATKSAPAPSPTATPVQRAQTTPGRSLLEPIITDYQRECARRMRLAMRGHNRQGARAWAAKCASLGEWRRA